jgi:DNA-binding response OmpR family regulator
MLWGEAVANKVLAGETILVVEDDPVAKNQLEPALQEAGADVVCADCARAVVLVERPFLSAAILDCYPQSGDRRAIIKRLRKRRVPFVIYSAEAPATVTSGLGAPWLEKPAPPAALIARLAVMLNKRR